MDKESLLTGDNAAFLDEKYLAWLDDPNSVDSQWAKVFEELDKDSVTNYTPQQEQPSTVFQARTGGGSIVSASVAHRQAKVAQLINAFRVRGHTEANIDPLGRRIILQHPELDPEYYGLTESDLDHVVSGTGVFGVGEFISLRALISRMRRAYCGGFGVEFMNINDPEKKKWLQRRFETLHDSPILDTEQQLRLLRHLADAENFEQLLHNRYPGTKRFSIEGAEPLIPLLASLIDHLSEDGAQRVMLGMAHRGRLNVLANILNKPIRYIIDEFDDESHRVFERSGDVKYHLGYSNHFVTTSGDKVRVTLAFNPSHLEAVNPVVEGRSRARQDQIGAGGEKAIVPLLLHGDA
ncbi:MAG: 2-oxoglutarate dehydrogenase E1 component, partial [Myxococcota bacterium]|nr:2-oxoglutarate dehydrogenase E1 component [Myxococcota bacterium]